MGGGLWVSGGGGGHRLNANLRKPVYGRIGTQSQNQAARFLNATAGQRLRRLWPAMRFGRNNHDWKYPSWSTRMLWKPKQCKSNTEDLQKKSSRGWQPFCFPVSICAQQQHALPDPERASVSLKASSEIRAATPGCRGNREARACVRGCWAE